MQLRDPLLEQGNDFRWRPDRDWMPLGAIVGRANVVGEVRYAPNVDIGDFDWRVHESDGQCVPRDLTPAERRWWMGGFALVLADVEPIAPVPCKGALGLWRVPEDVRRQIAEVR